MCNRPHFVDELDHFMKGSKWILNVYPDQTVLVKNRETGKTYELDQVMERIEKLESGAVIIALDSPELKRAVESIKDEGFNYEFLLQRYLLDIAEDID
jgi:hypothetical protein